MKISRDTVKIIGAFAIILICSLFLSSCIKNNVYEIGITIPVGSTEEFVYSDEEISPRGRRITVSAGDGLGDTEVWLKVIECKEENSYEPTYLTPGMPVVMDVEKGAWFKVGVSVQNETDENITVYVVVEGIDVRIE